MKLPKELLIKGESWSVSLGELDDDTLGEADRDAREIVLNSTMKKSDIKAVLIHEFLHAALYELHVTLEDGVEEVIVDGIAKCLLDSFHVRYK